MLESLHAKMMVWTANRTDMLLLPYSRNDREIAESMFMEGAPVSFINNQTLDLWQERRKIKPKLLSEWEPAAKTINGPLQPLNLGDL